VVFNDAVATRRTAREAGQRFPSDAVLSTALTQAKRTPARAWLAEVSAVVLPQALADANTAYRNVFASLTGTRKGRRLGAPRFRSKRDRPQSIRFTKAARFRVTDAGRLRLPGIGDVPVRWSRDLPSEPTSVTVTVDAAGWCHASFVVDAPDAPLPPVDREVGIDLGLTHFAVLSDGRKVDAPRIARKTAAKPRTAQRELARRAEGVGAAGALAPARAHVRPGRPVVALDPGMLGVRGDRRGQAVARPRVGMPVRHGARPDVNAARNILAAARVESSETLVELVSAGTPVPQPAVKQNPPGARHEPRGPESPPFSSGRGGRQIRWFVGRPDQLMSPSPGARDGSNARTASIVSASAAVLSGR
jgi:hypothetical protein